ncbi:sensor histidine kinase [Nocardioides allogilvus]|uniref:sensor histidine kinase n=1 Tax=Nocardioides allogilvus TaxID=2072017 RepID=UPI000D3129CF|nr:HAMP domain-containing sensor histidine kinase [Nocardioides allogilvus]
MTGSPALQDVPMGAAVSPSAARLVSMIVDTGTSLDLAFTLIAHHLLAAPRVDLVTAALTTFAPGDEAGWTHLGLRAWVHEWLSPTATCSILPAPGAGPEAALSMPWVSQRARRGVLAIADIEALPPEADEDRREIAGFGICSMVVGTQIADGVMFGSLAMGSENAGLWPSELVADFRLLNAALTSRIALEQARRSLAEAVDVGAQSRETQQHFLASIGHELRTPLTAIIGYTEMLVDEADDLTHVPFAAAVRRDGRVVLRACEQLMAVLEDLLTAGRAVGDTDQRETVDVSAAVADVLHWHRTAAHSAGVQLSSTVSAGQTVWAHPSGLRQVLANLVGNAVVHNGTTGTVVVAAESLLGESGEPRLRVIVRDNGPGLTAEQLGQAFEPFVRFAKPTVKGTGLGLSLSRSIAERDGGTIGAESTPGSGSAFWVELPKIAGTHHP